MTDAARALDPTRRVTTPIAEEIRLRLADAWGEMGAAWGVAPAIARVHAYLMTRQEPLTEREVREALNLSHRAASLALAEAEAWGLVERVAEPRRVGKRGPAGTAYMAIGDHWRWFGRVVAERKVREGDPIIVVLEKTLTEANLALATHPGDQDLIVLRDWLSTFLVFVRLFDRAVGLVSPPRADRAGARAAPPRRRPRRHDPPAREAPRRTAGRRRPRPRRGALPAVASVRPSRHDAHERGRPHAQPLAG